MNILRVEPHEVAGAPQGYPNGKEYSPETEQHTDDPKGMWLMKTQVSVRNMKLQAALREHLDALLERLGHGFHKLTRANVSLRLERAWYRAYIMVNGKRLCINAEAKSTNPRAALDLAVERVEKQLRRMLDRLHHHHGQRRLASLELVYDHMS